MTRFLACSFFCDSVRASNRHWNSWLCARRVWRRNFMSSRRSSWNSKNLVLWVMEILETCCLEDVSQMMSRNNINTCISKQEPACRVPSLSCLTWWPFRQPPSWTKHSSVLVESFSISNAPLLFSTFNFRNRRINSVDRTLHSAYICRRRTSCPGWSISQPTDQPISQPSLLADWLADWWLI